MRLFTVLVFSCVLGVSGVFAQPADVSAASDVEQPAEVVAVHDYPIAKLKAEVAPLRRASLQELADAKWILELQQAVSDLETLKLQDGVTGDQIAAAESRRNAIIERLSIVVDELEAKGGDGEEYRKFMAEVSGISVDWFDAGAVTSYIRAWAVSPDGGIRLALNIVKFVAILVIAWLAARLAGTIVSAAVRRLPKTSTLLRNFVVKITRWVVLVIGFVVALGALGLNIGPLVAAIGAAGLVIGLALQGTLSNFASGILILVYRPFDEGDVVSAGGVSGKVETMSLVQTTILTFDNQIQFVPNNEIWNSVITNITGRDTRRVDLKFGIGYDDDIAKAERIIREIVSEHEKVLAEPAPIIKVGELANSSVNFIVRPWAKTSDYWDVYWDITRRIKERFDAEDIGIPFPQQDLHIPGELRVVLAKSDA